MPITDINHYNLRGPMPELERIRDWYRDAVGLAVGDRPPFNHRGFWLYANGRPVLHLSEETPGESHPLPGSGTFDHVAFTCEDFAAMRGRLDGLNVKYRVADVPLTRTRQIFLRDPAGNGVELNFELTA
ncbi:MAG TPA: VOC family protein [Usitatibacter sp.]|jgi:glyoxylase I family protein|nr:VOC family protein [Usitatibacter sp.]